MADASVAQDASALVDAGDTDEAVAATVVDEEYAADDDPDLPNPERGIYYGSVQGDDPHTLAAEWLYLGDVCD